MKINALVIRTLMLYLMVTSLLSSCSIGRQESTFLKSFISEKVISSFYSSYSKIYPLSPTMTSLSNQPSSPFALALTGQASSKPVVISTDFDLLNPVITTVTQGKDLIITLDRDMKKEGLSDKIIKVLEDTGYAGYISGVEYTENGKTLIFKYIYKGGKDNFLSKIKAVNEKVDEIINKIIKPGMSDLEKEVIVHDYLVNNTNYDFKNLNNNTLPDDSFTAYGALINGTAVCSGYSEAMYRILNSIGVETLIVTGTANNVAHAWNMVKIDGSYYHLDATFDDPIVSSNDLISYNYFNINDSEISKDHVWFTENYPKCTSISINVYQSIK